MSPVSDPHAGQPVLRSGPPLKQARLVAILLHGRGASADDILGLAHQFGGIEWNGPAYHPALGLVYANSID